MSYEDDRVDGRAMPVERDEPGSDDLLLRGLLLALVKWQGRESVPGHT